MDADAADASDMASLCTSSPAPASLPAPLVERWSERWSDDGAAERWSVLPLPHTAGCASPRLLLRYAENMATCLIR